VLTRRGLLLIPDAQTKAPGTPDRILPLFETLPPAQALDRALEDISARYGQATADFVALTMEYPYGPTKRRPQGAQR
jgi:hypothetical protein